MSIYSLADDIKRLIPQGEVLSVERVIVPKVLEHNY